MDINKQTSHNVGHWLPYGSKLGIEWSTTHIWLDSLAIHFRFRTQIIDERSRATSAMTLVSVRNTRVFRMALTALTENRPFWLTITRYPSPRRRVALHTYLLYWAVTYKHHQNDACVTFFAVAAVMLKPFTQRLAVFNPWRCLCLSPAAASIGMLLERLEIIATTYR